MSKSEELLMRHHPDRHYVVGQTIVSWAGAPGCGRSVAVITRIDEEGYWGYEIENTIRELEPWETI